MTKPQNTPSPDSDMPILRLEGIHKSYGEVEILQGVSLDVQAGQVQAVLGPSGSGKSTMLRCMALLELPDAGDILFHGTPLGHDERRGKPLPERHLAVQRRRIGMVFQQFNLFSHLTALENVTVALTTVWRKPHDEAADIAQEMLREVGMEGFGSRYPTELSGGQQQRVAIARALAPKPEILLFDEPTSALDPELVGEVLRVIEDLAANGMTMVVVTHEVGFARRAADTVMMFDEGRIIEEAPPEEFFEAPRHPRTVDFLRHVL